MLKKILGGVAGLAAWVAVVLIAGLIMRAMWPDYARVADDMTFTLSMKLARLAVGAAATLAAGWVAGIMTRTPLVPALLGVALLIVFIPQHISLWQKFPLWYHLTFLLSLVPLSFWGGKMASP